MKHSVIPDDITSDEAKVLVLETADHCQKHNTVKYRDMFQNETTGKWCAVIYCPVCRAETGEVVMEFDMPEAVAVSEPPVYIEFNFANRRFR